MPASLHRHFERMREIFFVPFFHDPFAKPFRGSTASVLPRYGVSRSLLSNTLRLTANEKDPSAALGMTKRGNVSPFFHSATEANLRPFGAPPSRGRRENAVFRIVISSESEKSFSSPFPMTPSLSLLGKAPPPLFRDTVFPVPCCQTLSALPPTKKIPRLRSEGRNGERPLPISFHSAVSQPPPLRTASFQGKEGECRLPL